MKPLEITGRANYGTSAYIKLKRCDNFLRKFAGLVTGLGYDFYEKYQQDITGIYNLKDNHDFFENNEFKAHIVFGSDYIHLMIEFKDLDKLNKILEKHCKWAKV